ncbi:MAG: excinuclease ABC subunit UvrC [Flavobacteriaceae bacterium]|nr:excinuclease ABC subunit UvrC [Flavobacteriaceae bacterium]
MYETSLEIQLKTLPNLPGVYLYIDAKDTVIYVGKAKRLKKRVSSYFTKNHEYGKTRVLVKKIVKIKHIVVDTETDALLLENNLIKKYKPRYNVLLKDDKTYPWLCIKNEHFPRIFPTRRYIKDGSEYFGPYTSMKTIHTLLEVIKSLYTLRTCETRITPEKIAEGKTKLCLGYHIHVCNGACGGLVSEAAYKTTLDAVRNILKGNFKTSLQQFKAEMKTYASQLEFEKAQVLKEKIALLENYQAKSTIVNPKISNVDVFSIVSDESAAFVNFLQISYGAIVRSHTLELKKKLEESDKALLELGITELRQRFNSNSKEIYVPFKVNLGESIKVTIPKLGDKKHILNLSERNAKYHRLERLKQIKITDPERHFNRLMVQMKADLRLSEEPRHIECFDNSNIQGTHPVAACVVFKNGKPSKRDYRHFNIKTVEGPDDFASMTEVVYRRYKRLLDEDKPLPQLIVIDGGKGQLSAALKSLDDLNLRGKIAIIGIAKRLEELFYPNDPIPLYLDKKSQTLKIIQQLRNEAHRFGIEHHRNKRSKNALHTELETISGIGEKSIVMLLKHFKSAKRVSYATLDELEDVVGVSRAKKIYNYYNSDTIHE